MTTQPPAEPDLSEYLWENGQCCICKKALNTSKQVNFAMLDKFITWKFPGWGNILAKKAGDRMAARALAVVCDSCYNANRNRKLVGEVQFAIEVDTINKQIVYHPVEDLRDAPKIKLRRGA